MFVPDLIRLLTNYKALFSHLCKGKAHSICYILLHGYPKLASQASARVISIPPSFAYLIRLAGFEVFAQLSLPGKTSACAGLYAPHSSASFGDDLIFHTALYYRASVAKNCILISNVKHKRSSINTISSSFGFVFGSFFYVISAFTVYWRELLPGRNCGRG